MKWYSGDNQVGSRNLTWAEVGVDDLASDTSWNYTFPDDGGIYRYEFTYYTVADVSGRNGSTYVQNNLYDPEWHSASAQTNLEPGTGAIGIEKVAVGTPTHETMSWSVTLTVPASGLTRAILTDYLPKTDYSGYRFQDTFLEDTLRVTGLEPGESYWLRVNKDRFILTFYQDEGQTVHGLKGTGSQRTITVTFDTANDQAWASMLRDGWHTNTATFEGSNGIVTDTAEQQIPASGFEKKAEKLGMTQKDGDSVLLIEYTLDLYGVGPESFTNDELIITDEYDGNKYLQLYPLTTDSFGNVTNALDGMNSYWGQVVQNGFKNCEHKDAKVAIADANNYPGSDHGTLTFTLNRSDFPLNNGAFYPRYQIVYYMVVKNAAAQTQLDEDSVAAEGRTIHLNNTAHWGELTDDATVDYTTEMLSKEHIDPIGSASADSSHYDASTGLTGFRITVNPNRRTLNGGNPLTVKDEFSDNLSVVYSSIKIYLNDSETPYTGPDVSYDYRGTTGTFTVPDGTKVVIEYNAKVIGNSGQWISYGNVATMHGYRAEVNGYSQVAGGGEGGFNINSIKVYKYAAGDMTHPIPGVTFTMVDENGDPVVYTKASDVAGHAHNVGDPVTFTTGDDGYVKIEPSEDADGFSLQKGITYYIKETGTPSDYAFNSTIYRFTLSDHPDYSRYEYHSGDIMKIYNWPTTGRLEIRKSIVGGPEHMTDEDKRQITFTIKGWYDQAKTKPVMVDAWGYTVSEAKAATDGKTEFSRNITYADFVRRTQNGTD